MLAQLDERSDVDTAEVDRRGELLRIRLHEGGAVTAIREALEGMGFAADEEVGVDVAAAQWYGPSAVSELSREEAGVIAARVVPVFGAANALERGEVDAVSARVAEALYACFVGQRDVMTPASALATSCGRAVDEATRPLLGAARAAVLGRAVEIDLTGGAPP